MQILPAVQKRESFSSALGRNVGAGISQGVEEGLSNRKRMAALAQEDQALEEMGIKVSGLTPEMKKVAVAEMLKSQGKQNIQNQNQSFLENLISSKKQSVEKTGESPGNSQQNVMDDGLSPIEQLTDEDIVLAESKGIRGLREAKDAKLKAKESKEKESRRQFESDRDYHSKVSDPILKSAEGVVKEYPIKKGLIDQQRRDISSGNTEGIIPFLVDKLGLESFRDPESARFKTASKERFVASIHELGGAGARANQFIEQQLVSAQAALGRDQEANQTVLDMEEFINDMKNERARIELDLAEKDIEEHGYAKRDIAYRADKLMKEYANKRQDEMAYDIRYRHEEKLDDVQLAQEIASGKVPTDTPLTMRAARILMLKNGDDEKAATKEAKSLGFKIPLDSTYERGM